MNLMCAYPINPITASLGIQKGLLDAFTPGENLVAFNPSSAGKERWPFFFVNYSFP